MGVLHSLRYEFSEVARRHHVQRLHQLDILHQQASLNNNDCRDCTSSIYSSHSGFVAPQVVQTNMTSSTNRTKRLAETHMPRSACVFRHMYRIDIGSFCELLGKIKQKVKTEHVDKAICASVSEVCAVGHGVAICCGWISMGHSEQLCHFRCGILA